MNYYIFGKNLIKLNLTVCENNKIDILLPVEISENLDKYNVSSGYYNDICYITTSDSGTDISLNDRKTEFIEGNKTACQEDCIFSSYDSINKRAKCSCKVKDSSFNILEMKINKTKLYENFIDIKNIGNFKIMICYKVLFSKKGIIYNIGFYLNIIILIFHYIATIIFYTKQKHVIYKKIKDINFGIYNLELVLANEKENNNTEKKKVNKNMNKKTKKLKERKSKNKNNELIIDKKDKIITNHNKENKLNKGNNPPKKRQKLIKFEF